MTMISAMIILVPYCKATEPAHKGQTGRTSVGIDIVSGICFKCIRIIATHGISHHWDTAFDVTLDPKTFWPSTSDMEQEHRETLDGDLTESSKTDEDCQVTDLRVGYWPITTFRGPYLTIGARFTRNGTPDMLIGLGYTFEIRKGISGTIGYHPGIIETFRKRRLSYESIRASISYVF